MQDDETSSLPKKRKKMRGDPEYEMEKFELRRRKRMARGQQDNVTLFFFAVALLAMAFLYYQIAF